MTLEIREIFRIEIQKQLLTELYRLKELQDANKLLTKRIEEAEQLDGILSPEAIPPHQMSTVNLDPAIYEELLN